MDFTVETEQEKDNRWIAEIIALPGVLTYGISQAEAVTRAKALALSVLDDCREHGEA